MADKRSQMPGGSSDPLPNNFSAKHSFGRKNAPKIENAEAGGNATGPALSNQRGQQQNG